MTEIVQSNIAYMYSRITNSQYNGVDGQPLSENEWCDRITYHFLVKKDMCIENQGRSQQHLNSPANKTATVTKYWTAHLCDADGWNSQAYDQHKRQQGIRKGMLAQLRMTTYKLCQDKTHVIDGIHKKSDDIMLPSASEN
jgi:hypothetical protein